MFVINTAHVDLWFYARLDMMALGWGSGPPRACKLRPAGKCLVADSIPGWAHYTPTVASPFLFLLPSLGRLSTTARTKTRKPAPGEPTQHSTEPSRGHHSHHLPHLGVFVDHRVNVLDLGAASARYPLASRRIKQRMIAALLNRH